MSAITITGRSVAGSQLQLTLDGLQINPSDVNGQVVWYRNGVQIDGVNGLTYTPTAADQLSILTADVVYKGLHIISDQRVIEAPSVDTLLFTNQTLQKQFAMDVLQTTTNLQNGSYVTAGTLIDMQNPQLVTIDDNFNGSILRVDKTTDAVLAQDLTTGQVQELTSVYPAGLETAQARLAAGFRVLSTNFDPDNNGQKDLLSVATTLDSNNQPQQHLYINNQLLQINNETNSLTANGGYALEAVTDFDGNGTSDILLFNASHNALEALTLSKVNGAVVAQRTVLATIQNGFSVDSVADSTGDGKADVLLRNAQSGQLELLKMHTDNGVLSTTLSGVDTQMGNISPDYQIIDRVDFDRNGTQDLLWQGVNGTTYISLLDSNGNMVATNNVESYSDWKVVSAVVDATGKPELVFQQDVTGTLALAPLIGTSLDEAHVQLVNYGSAWKIGDIDQISVMGVSNDVLPVSLFA